MFKFYSPRRSQHANCRLMMTKTAFRNWRKLNHEFTYMNAFRFLGGR